MNKRINIVLPDTTVTVLDRVAPEANRSRFIDLAVRYYVETQSKRNLRQQLASGYRANADRDLAIGAEWFPLEEEASRIAEEARPARRAGTSKRK